MPNTYTLIASVTVGAGGASSIDFTSIPATYTDLVLKVSARTNRSGVDIDDELRIQFNNSTSSYADRMIEGNGTSTRSAYDTPTYITRGQIPTDNATGSTFGNSEYYIPNYAGSNNKSLSLDTVTENDATLSYCSLVAGLWSNSSAITSIKLTALGTFEQYSSAYLYGIKNS